MKTETLPETLPMDWTKYNAKGECGCVICGKKLPKRHGLDKGIYVHIGEGGNSILRADLPTGTQKLTIMGKEYTSELTMVNGKLDTGDMGWHLIGPDCAKKLGKAYVKVLDAFE